LADTLKHSLGFRKIAAHNYQALHLPITISNIVGKLDDFFAYRKTLLKPDAERGGQINNGVTAVAFQQVANFKWALAYMIMTMVHQYCDHLGAQPSAAISNH